MKKARGAEGAKLRENAEAMAIKLRAERKERADKTITDLASI